MFTTAAVRSEGTGTAHSLSLRVVLAKARTHDSREAFGENSWPITATSAIDGSRGMGPGFRQDDAGVLDGSPRRLTTAAVLLRRVAHLGAFGPGRAELELRDLAERIERRVGQEIGRRFRVAERHENHVLRNVAVRPHLDLDRAAAGFEPNEIARCELLPVHVL